MKKLTMSRTQGIIHLLYHSITRLSKPMTLMLFALCSLPSAMHAQVDLYGYFEPQYSAFYRDSTFYQTNHNKLRVDLKSTAVKNTEFGANIIYLLYFGKKDWNMLDFLPRRIVALIPPDMYPYYQLSFQDTFYLDNAYARLNIKRTALTIGKQQISMGTGYFSNPTDVLNVKDALDPTYEQPGHNALRLDFYIGSRVNLMALYTPIEFDWENSGKLIRVKAGIKRFDFSITGHELQYTTTDFYTFQQTQQRRRLLGADFVGELLGLGIWGEGICNFMEDDDDNWYEFILGTDYTLESGLYAMVEYHRNSLGKPTHNEYFLNDWMRYFVGETKTLSRDQMYGFIQYPLSDLILVGSSAIYSISDRSVAIVPTIYYSLFENVDLTLMFNFYLGEEGKLFSSSLGNGGYLRAQIYF
ncbi:MAG: hypothetical protein WBB37_09745 [bacterium]